MVSDFARGHNELSRAQAVSILLVMAVRHMIGPMRHWQYLRASRAIVTQTYRGENCFFYDDSMKKNKGRIVRVSRFLNFLIVNGFSNLETYNADVPFILYLNHNYCSCEKRGITKQNKTKENVII